MTGLASNNPILIQQSLASVMPCPKGYLQPGPQQPRQDWGQRRQDSCQWALQRPHGVTEALGTG